MKVDLSNRTVLITGASSGIGYRTANVFAANGAIIINADVNEEAGLKMLEEIKREGGKAVFIKTDVGNIESVQRMTEQTIGKFGKIDMLINNAGININFDERANINQFSDEKWRQILKVDLDGVYNCSKAVLNHMIKQGKGKIINISSVAGIVPLRQQCAFVAAKTAVIGLTKATALEMGPFGITVNAIVPGSIKIDLMKQSGFLKDGRDESIISHIPLKRQGKPEDIAYAALYLSSDVADYVTGSVLTVDGGWTCGYTRDW